MRGDFRSGGASLSFFVDTNSNLSMSKVNQIIHGMQTASLPSDYWWTTDIEFPELEMSRAVTQRNNQSVWEHTMSVIDLLTIKNPITLLSGLFHDLGKCCVTPMDDTSLPRFPGHAYESANIAEIRLTEWGCSASRIDRIARLITMHMYDISNAAREKTIRKFVADVGPRNLDNWFALRIADSRSYAAQQQYRNHFIEPFRIAVMSYMKQQPGINQLKLESPGAGGMKIEGGDVS